MNKQTQTTENTSLPPFDYAGLSYSPALLLDGRLSASITDDPDFPSCCKWGFDVYLEELEDGSDIHKEDGIKVFVHREMFEIDPFGKQASLVCRAGVILGTLSALALVDRTIALVGLHCFTECMK